MVKFTSAFFVFATLALSVFASPIEQPDVDRVKGELRSLARDVTSFNEEISNIHAPVSFSQALTLRSNVVHIGNEIEETTENVKHVPSVSFPDAKAIMSEVENFIPIIVAALKNLKTKKNDLHSIPISNSIPMIQELIKDLDVRSLHLADALIAAAPGGLKAQATKDRDTVQAVFKDVIDYYDH